MSPVQVKEKIIDQVYRNLPYSQRPKVESVALGNLSALHRNTAALFGPAGELQTAPPQT